MKSVLKSSRSGAAICGPCSVLKALPQGLCFHRQPAQGTAPEHTQHTALCWLALYRPHPCPHRTCCVALTGPRSKHKAPGQRPRLELGCPELSAAGPGPARGSEASGSPQLPGLRLAGLQRCADLWVSSQAAAWPQSRAFAVLQHCSRPEKLCSLQLGKQDSLTVPVLCRHHLLSHDVHVWGPFHGGYGHHGGPELPVSPGLLLLCPRSQARQPSTLSGAQVPGRVV